VSIVTDLKIQSVLIYRTYTSKRLPRLTAKTYRVFTMIGLLNVRGLPRLNPN